MEKENQKIALLIDAENEPNHVEFLLKQLLERGVVPYRRIYGKTTITKAKWQGYENLGLKIVAHSSDKQNATDIRLCIDALNILHEQKPDVICIMSGDGDYTALVNEIRERNVYVIIASRKDSVNTSIRAASDEWICLESEEDSKNVSVKAESNEIQKEKADVVEDNVRPTNKELAVLAKKILKNAGGRLDIGNLCSKIYAETKMRTKYPKFKFEQGEAKEFFLNSKLTVEKNKGGTYFVSLQEE